MGKTSLSNYLLKLFQHKYNLIGVHIHNNNINNVNSLIKTIIESILNEIKSEPWSEKIIEPFKDNIKSVGFMNTNIKFIPKNEDLNYLRKHFPQFLKELTKKFEEKKGLIIVIDDINGLSKTPEFANWYKSFADTLATNKFINNCPVSFILTGYPEKLNNLYKHNPSFQRIFKHHLLKELSEKEVKSFYMDVFNDIEVICDKKAINNMIYYSGGMPTMMQEIGDGVFWYLPENKHITVESASKGITYSGGQIGVKYLQPILDDSIQSTEYLNIFEKLGVHIAKSNTEIFTRNEIINNFNIEEKTVDRFISRAKELKIIETVIRGKYKFTNKLYPLYLLIRSQSKL